MTSSNAPSGYSLAVLLDESRRSVLRGTTLENRTTDMFGGSIKALILTVTPEQSKVIIAAFARARTDSRGFLEELPISFKRALFEEIVRSKSIGPEVIDAVLAKLDAIKVEASKEEDRLPPPTSRPASG
ncbi:MAG: DUF6955 family protein [Thermoplasmata archaeon]